MSDLIAMSPSEMLAAASQLQAKNSTLLDVIQGVKSQVVSMEGTWQGQASLNFQSIMDEWNGAITNVQTTLEDVNSRLQTFESQMSELDSSTKF